MKLIKILTIDSQPIELVEEDVRLHLRQPGRASFTINGAVQVDKLVTLDIGYQPNTVRFFTGWVEAVNQVNAQQQMIVCRELSATLDRTLPISLRRVDLKQILSVVSEITGLKFRVPSADYSTRKVSHCCHAGGGYHLMDSLGDVFNISDYIWQQQGDGEIFVGSWADSFWSQKPAEIPDNILDKHHASGSVQIPMVPRLKPGVFLSNRGYIISLQLINGNMVFSCAKALKK